LGMTNFLQHRGPDDVGVEELACGDSTPAATFGHRRLAIVDVSTHGHQPMFSTDLSICLTYNGEIYNFMELRRELEASGTKFKSVCDTEVIVEGYRKIGPDYFARLRGMFVLAIWDKRIDKGYLARDTFGIKPLYIAEREGDIFFASEVRAILATGRVEKRLSSAAVNTYLSTGSVAEPLTIIEGVTAIPAGCFLEVGKSGDRFSLGPAQRFSSSFRAETSGQPAQGSPTSRIRAALRDSVKHHLVADVPVGVFLSGGIDSCAVAGLASEIADKRLQTFTVVFEEADFSEAEIARKAAHRFGTEHHEVMLEGRDLLNALPDVFNAMDQPSLDGLNTFVVSRAVHTFGLKVVLSGLGGDELFGGYPSFYRAQTVAPLWQLPPALRRLGALGISPFDDQRISRIGSMLGDGSAAHAAYRASRTLFDDRHVERLTGATRQSAVQAADEIDGVAIHTMTLQQQVSHYELTGYMRNTLLRDSDVFSMAHALELRVPMVDTEVARVAQEAIATLKLDRGQVKPLLVEAMSDLLDGEQQSSKKMGFTLPFDRWMRKEMHSEVDSVLRGKDNPVSLNISEVGSVWQAFEGRKSGVNWSRPWALYTLMRWAKLNGVSYSPAMTEGKTRYGLAG
ncbi:MAG TPA: asparagine synthase (glutamine-hydrolyzing), partial [Gemmatimonadaceae bacterium]|nr:asparagine synthase (glutamine-hydrolyzing) [Gemmatimonadaceae bacterium]